MLLFYYVEFAGIHADPSLRFGGNRISKLAVRSDDQTAQTSGLSGDMPHSRKLSPATKRKVNYHFKYNEI